MSDSNNKQSKSRCDKISDLGTAYEKMADKVFYVIIGLMFVGGFTLMAVPVLKGF